MFRLIRVRRAEFLRPMTWRWRVASLLFFGCILLVYWVNQTGWARITVCPTTHVFGIPCPLCGGTTAAVRLARGEVAPALASNPLAVLLVVAIAGYSLLWLAFARRLTTTLPAPMVAALLLLALAANWAYVLSVRT